MWLILAFISAGLLGIYDIFKKQSLRDNAVIPVLFLSTVFSTLIFLPFIVLSAANVIPEGALTYVPRESLDAHLYIILKACIVSASWIFGYFALKNLPITIVGPINATRPVIVLLGALLIFGERLNLYQWIGVVLAIIAVFLLSRGGKKEGIDFVHNKWILFVVIAALLGAFSALYDKYIMGVRHFDAMFVQSWCNLYVMIIMLVTFFLLWYPKRKAQPFHWTWAILFISIFLSVADFAYFSSLSQEGALISVVSMVRRGNVIVSFLCGALIFKEKNLKSKAAGLAVILVALVFLYLGSR